MGSPADIDVSAPITGANVVTRARSHRHSERCQHLHRHHHGHQRHVAWLGSASALGNNATAVTLTSGTLDINGQALAIGSLAGEHPRHRHQWRSRRHPDHRRCQRQHHLCGRASRWHRRAGPDQSRHRHPVSDRHQPLLRPHYRHPRQLAHRRRRFPSVTYPPPVITGGTQRHAGFRRCGACQRHQPDLLPHHQSDHSECHLRHRQHLYPQQRHHHLHRFRRRRRPHHVSSATTKVLETRWSSTKPRAATRSPRPTCMSAVSARAFMATVPT